MTIINKTSSLKGQDIIRFIAKTLPHKPGVYQMEDSKGNILYIGKAKDLSKRVKSYFAKTHEDVKTNVLVSKIKGFDFVVD